MDVRSARGFRRAGTLAAAESRRRVVNERVAATDGPAGSTSAGRHEHGAIITDRADDLHAARAHPRDRTATRHKPGRGTDQTANNFDTTTAHPGDGSTHRARHHPGEATAQLAGRIVVQANRGADVHHAVGGIARRGCDRRDVVQAETEIIRTVGAIRVIWLRIVRTSRVGRIRWIRRIRQQYAPRHQDRPLFSSRAGSHRLSRPDTEVAMIFCARVCRMCRFT